MASAQAALVWATVCRQLAEFFANVQTGDVIRREDSLLLLSGGPTADFNVAVLEASGSEEQVLREFAARVRTAGVPALFMLPGAASERVAQAARDEGLSEAGTAPLMLLDQPRAIPARAAFTVERVRDTAALSVVADLIASAFGLDRLWVGRTFAAPAQLATAIVEFWLASKDAEPYSAVTCLSGGHDDLVGIWSMATHPSHQREGAGRAVLEAVMRGNRRYYLISTPAGQPLYDALGFRTIDQLSVYVAGHSEQFASH